MESSNSEERDQIDRPPVPREDEAGSESAASAEGFQSDEWWRASAPTSDWAEPVSDAAATEIGQRKETGTADIYFCGRRVSVEPCDTSHRKREPDRFAPSLLGPGTDRRSRA